MEDFWYLIIAIIFMIICGVYIIYFSVIWAFLVGMYHLLWVVVLFLYALFNNQDNLANNFLLNITIGFEATFEALLYLPKESWQFARYEHPYYALAIAIIIWLCFSSDKENSNFWRNNPEE